MAGQLRAIDRQVAGDSGRCPGFHICHDDSFLGQVTVGRAGLMINGISALSRSRGVIFATVYWPSCRKPFVAPDIDDICDH